MTQSGTLDSVVELTDQVDGTLLIDNGDNPQRAIRPINELAVSTLAQLTADDLLPIYDVATATHRSVSVANILTDNFDNDIGVGADGKIETGFSLHRDTTTTGAYWRHWANNTGTNPALASSGLLYGYSTNLVTGNSWNTANITSTAK